MINDRKLPHQIRRAFYEGLARACLDWAWIRLDDHRQEKPLTRRFRGRIRERKGVPVQELARFLARSPGEISRWFGGSSPSWANLTLVMTALGADWPQMQQLPSKSNRREAACWEAILLVRRLTKEEKTKQTKTFGPHIVRFLLALFSDDCWPQDRQVPERRARHLERVAKQLQMSAKELDEFDAVWGNYFTDVLQVYASSLDEQIWQ